MEKELLKHLRIGRTIKEDATGENYRVFEADAVTGTILACPANKRFCRENAVIELKAEEVSSAEQIRFITPDYETLFEVENFGFVRVDGVLKQVAIHDEYHFNFIGNWNTFHICQYAELCKRDGRIVERA